MNRRDFFRWFKYAPVALPAMATAAIAGDGISMDGNALYLGGEKIMERRPDGMITIGPGDNIQLMTRDALLKTRETEFQTIQYCNFNYGSPQDDPHPSWWSHEDKTGRR